MKWSMVNGHSATTKLDIRHIRLIDFQLLRKIFLLEAFKLATSFECDCQPASHFRSSSHSTNTQAQQLSKLYF